MNSPEPYVPAMDTLSSPLSSDRLEGLTDSMRHAFTRAGQALESGNNPHVSRTEHILEERPFKGFWVNGPVGSRHAYEILRYNEGNEFSLALVCLSFPPADALALDQSCRYKMSHTLEAYVLGPSQDVDNISGCQKIFRLETPAAPPPAGSLSEVEWLALERSEGEALDMAFDMVAEAEEGAFSEPEALELTRHLAGMQEFFYWPDMPMGG